MTNHTAEWGDTLLHLLALVARLEGEGQYNIARLALPQHLNGCHRPLCAKCVPCLFNPWDRVGVGLIPTVTSVV